MAQWAAEAGAKHLIAMGIGPPSRSTLARTARDVDPTELDKALGAWIRDQHPPGPRVVAVDGKEVRGAKNAGGERVHLLPALDQATGVVLGQVSVGAKTNEIPCFPVLVGQLGDVTDWVFTADALHTQKTTTQILPAEGAHWIWTVRDNQPGLRARLAHLAWSDARRETYDRDLSHGRAVTRTSKALIVEGIGFPGAVRAIRLIRHRRDEKGRRTREIVYAITDMGPERASSQQLAAMIRGHWAVENREHWVRDVTFDEDRSQLRTGNSPHVMATLRNLAISLFRLAGETNIAQTLRHLSWNPEIAMALTGL